MDSSIKDNGTLLLHVAGAQLHRLSYMYCQALVSLDILTLRSVEMGVIKRG
jgi:hypothetical protein